MRLLSSIILLSAINTPVMAEQLPLERITASPSLAGPVAREVHVSPDGENVAYLRSADDDRYRQDLWIYERSSGRARRLIDARSLGVERAPSPEEAARRERERVAGTRGIVHYEWSPDGRRLMFGVGDALYIATLRGDGDPAIRVVARGTNLLDPRLSPHGRFVAFIRGQNLHVIDLASGVDRALTRDGGGTIHNAEAEFIAQEEMDQFRGYWWAPDESAIVFKRFDESRVPIMRRFEIQADRTDVVEQRYPLAGGPNVGVRLGLVRPAGGPVRWLDLGSDPEPYLPRVDWLPDGKAFSYQWISRDQKTLELRIVTVRDLRQRTVRTDHSRTWIDLHDDLHFLQRQPTFVWAADRGGRKHLELVGLDGRSLHAITSGDWQVDKLLAVDEDAGVAYVAGDTADAFERHVWRVRLDGSNADHPERLTAPGGCHIASFPEGPGPVRLWVDRYSDPSTPPQTSIRDPDGGRLAWIEENAMGEGHPYRPYLDHHVVPEFGRLPADDGTPLNYALMKPPGFDPNRRYPGLLYVYGGPDVQIVTREWGRAWMQAIVQRGYLIFMVDNRGSSRRGRAFSDVIYHRHGDFEVRDQLTALDWLDRQPGVDPKRVAVFGGSYGGYLTLMLLAKAPQGRFAAGIAAAPVTRQSLYDTFYTERYLGMPQENPAGYEASSVFSVIDGLKTPLLLIHGMADDNVFFTHSTELMAALQKRGIQFRLMTYPGGKHGLSDRALQDHEYRLLADYLDEKL